MADKNLKAVNDNLALSKIKIGDNIYNLKDAEGRNLITAETTRATGVESGLDTRVSNLEARGRYLSTWNCATGLPGDYPQIPEGATSPYTYNFKAGDYYIINNIPALDTKYMPFGSSITATQSGETWTWAVGKKEYEGEASLVVGGQFVFSTTGWNYVATAKDTAWGQIIGTLSNQTDLKDALDAKINHKTGKTGAAGDLAYKDSASGTVTEKTATGAATGSITTSVTGDLGFSAADATLTKVAYTPSGTITGDAIKGGTVTVTLSDNATAVTNLEFEDYTPEGTIDKPAINLTKSGVSVLTEVSTAGTLPSFTEGAFSAATIDSSKFFNAGNVNLGTFNAGSMPTLGTATTGSFATAGLIFSSYADEMITFANATLASAVTAQGSLTGGAVPTWTGSSVSAPSIDVSAGFFGGSKAADTFTSGAMPTFASSSVNNVTAAALAAAPAFTGTASAVKLSGAKYLKQEISAASFSGTAASLSFSGAIVSSAFVTGVSYSKATKGTLSVGASITGGSLSVSVTVPSQTVTVS